MQGAGKDRGILGLARQLFFAELMSLGSVSNCYSKTKTKGDKERHALPTSNCAHVHVYSHSQHAHTHMAWDGKQRRVTVGFPRIHKGRGLHH